MQSAPPSWHLGSVPRARGLTFVLVGGALIFLGTLLSYTWSVLFVMDFPEILFLYSPWSVLATIVSAFGEILAALGFLLVFYGITHFLGALLRGRAGSLPNSPAPETAVLLGETAPRIGQGTSPLIMAGAGLVFLGQVVESLSQFLVYLDSSSAEMFRFEFVVTFVGGAIAAAGFGVAFYGIVTTIRRLS